MRRLSALVALVLAAGAPAAGCGGSGEIDPDSIQPPLQTAPTGADRGKKVLASIVAAARSGGAKGLGRLLSTPSKKRLGPFERFRQSTATELAEGVGSFSRAPYR